MQSGLGAYNRTIAHPCNHDRFAAQALVLSLLNGSIEGTPAKISLDGFVLDPQLAKAARIDDARPNVTDFVESATLNRGSPTQ
jgi:hypothetical protein